MEVSLETFLIVPSTLRLFKLIGYITLKAVAS